MKKVLEGARQKFRLNPMVQKTRRLIYSPFSYDIPFILTHVDPKSNLNEQLYWMEQMFQWISLSGELPSETESTSKTSIQLVRIKFLLHLLNRNPVWKSRLAETLRLIVKNGSCLELFSMTGLHQEFGFWAEAADRVVKNVLPTPPDASNLSEFFSRVFAGDDTADWFAEMSPELFLQITELFFFEAEIPDEVFTRTRDDIQDAIAVLAAMIGGVGLSRDLLRTRTGSPHESPFYRLSTYVSELITRMHQTENNLELVDSINPCLQQLHECREDIRKIFRNLEDRGVSIAVVYRLYQLQFALSRVETLLHMLYLKRDRDSLNIIIAFLAELIREQNENRGIMSLFRSNLRLLSRKIVERTGVTGEHYITSTKSEYLHMLKSAFGGGFLTVFTLIFKSGISSLKLPFFWDFIGAGVNYAGSFVAIQLFGFTLATKQPSATAAHLAGKLDNLNSQDKLDGFVEEFKKISRSQFAAAAGNIGMALPASAFMFVVYSVLTGKPIFSPEYAEYTIRSLNPVESFTILYAALTGVLLWISSIAGGWVENWIVFRRIPDAIAQNRRLRSRFGPERAEKFAKWLSHNAAGFGSNSTLGFLLAGVPIFSRLFGIGLDVRHVTLSTCALTFATCSLWGHPELGSMVAWSSGGVVIIGLLNFGVSFYLALTVAARARSLTQATVFFLFKEVFRAFLRGPREFFFPR